MILSTTTTDKATITPRMYFEDDAGTYGAHVYIPPATTITEIAQHRMQRYTTGGSQVSTMFVSGDGDGTDGDPFSYIGVNGSNSITPYTRIYSHYHNLSAGSDSAATLTFGDADTGIYSGAANTISITCNGNKELEVSASGLYVDSWGGGTATAVHVSPSDMLIKDTSSIRFKDNVVDIETDTSNIYDLRPVTFNWNDKSAHPGKKDIGLIAEETEKIYPEIVNYDKNGLAESISYQKLSVLLLSEMKKLRDEIKELKENK